MQPMWFVRAPNWGINGLPFRYSNSAFSGSRSVEETPGTGGEVELNFASERYERATVDH
jgi:hypothetical protein